jgi:hypothetical protein
MDVWAQDVAAIATVSAAIGWLVARWLRRQPKKPCSGCVPRSPPRAGRLPVLR